MSHINPKEALVIRERNGIAVYSTNPSIPDKHSVPQKLKKKQLGDEQKGMIIDGSSGEIIGRGTAIVYEWEEIDSERFVKLFIGGLRKAAGLSKAGLLIFEIVYTQMRLYPNTDKIELSFWHASQHSKTLNQRTYQRGIRELLEREILYRSPSESIFFVDITCMFNGDRLAFVKGYHIKGSTSQGELALAPPQSDISNNAAIS